MSQENVELVRSLYVAGDLFSATPDQIGRVFRDSLDEGFELRLPPDYPEGEQVFRGRDEIAKFAGTLRDTWGEWRFEPERFLDAGDHVVVFARLVARGGASGLPIDLETSHVWTIRAGRAMSIQVYRDRAAALQAAGLRQ